MSGLDAASEPAEIHLTPPPPAELKAQIRDWRRGRATRKVGEALSDAYVAVIGALMIGAMVVNVILKTQRTVAGCTSVTCVSSRAILPLAAFAGAVAVALAASRLFGPVLASAAEGFWLLDAPISRAAMLRSRLVAIVVVSGLGGGLLGGLVSALTGSGVREISIWAAATGLSAAASVAFAAAQQGVEKHRLVRVVSFVFGLTGVAALLAVVATSAGMLQLGLSGDRSEQLGLLIVGLAAVVAVISLILAGARLRQIRRQRLLSGGSLVSGVSGAMYALDLGLARDIVVERHAAEVGHVHAVRGTGVGLAALTWREWQRLRRFPQPLVVLAGTIVVPYASEALGMSAVTSVFGALALFGAMVPLFNSLRVLTRTGGLARCFPYALPQIKLAVVRVPAVLAAVWAALTAGAFVGFGNGTHHTLLDATLMAVATAGAGLLAAVRWTTAKGVDYSQPMVSTQAGALPPGLIMNLFRGFDICLLVTAPMLLGFSPVWSLVIGAVAALILFNTTDLQSLQAKQEEQKRELERQRTAASATRNQRKR